MAQILRFDGVDYDISTLSAEGRAALERVRSCDARMAELRNMRALLVRAKNSYLSELRSEIVAGKSGVDLASLFSD